MLVGCCGLLLGLALSTVIAGFVLRSYSLPPHHVKDACSNERFEGVRVLDGLPFQCGWQQLRPTGFGGSSHIPHAFIQPNGSWCWSNAGFLGSRAIGTDGNGKPHGLLIDTLTDPVLTEGMLVGLHVDDLLFTHPDVDHILGNQAVSPQVPRHGTRESQAEIDSTRQSGAVDKLRFSVSAGYHVWSFASRFGVGNLIAALPGFARDYATSVLGFAHMQAAMAVFNFHIVDMEKLPKIDKFLDSSQRVYTRAGQFPNTTVRDFGPIHSKSDSVIYHWASKVVYAGDLLFIGIAPVMWAGPAMKWITALREILDETRDGGWLYVPGHGPVTDAEGVRTVLRYFEYLDAAVSTDCADLSVHDRNLDDECGDRVLAKMPSDLLVAFREPQRILICAAIERMSRSIGGPVKVQLQVKVKYLSKMGVFQVQQMLKKTKPQVRNSEL